jgi:starch-binding outer membrane protein, SusD/RagB family
LDTKDLTNKSSGNFPKTVNDCNQSLAGIYNTISQGWMSSFYIGALASDEAFGAGAANDYDCHGFDRWRVSTPNMSQDFWKNYYAGIFRTNKLIESLDNVSFSSVDEKKRMLGEASFMRAFFYSELVKVYGEVPLIISAAKPVNLPKSKASDIYAQVASDLKIAIENLPGDKQGVTPDRFGHGTKWAAEALAARVFLFYTGYYKQNDLPLKEGGSITKQQVVAYLEDVITNSGHQLVPDFRNLWPYTNKDTKEDYKYTKGKKLLWAGDNNRETVFAIKFGYVAKYGEPSNTPCLFFGIRGQTSLNNAFPYGDGYGQATVNPNMVNQWIADEPNDSIRRWGSVIDVANPREGFRKYEIGGWNMVEETKLFQKKYQFVHVYTDKTSADPMKWKSVLNYVFTNETSRLVESLQDFVLIRYSDVLLMHSELTGTAVNLNLVRARAGLPAVSYSMENLIRERKYELAFEGMRYYDLLRWYGTEAGVLIDKNQSGADVLNDKVPGKYKDSDLTIRIRATGGFMQVPESEITLSNGVLVQNEGWNGGDMNLQ